MNRVKRRNEIAGRLRPSRRVLLERTHYEPGKRHRDVVRSGRQWLGTLQDVRGQ